MNDEKVKQWQMAPLHALTDLGVQAGSLSDIAEFVGSATTAYFAFELLPRYRVRRAIVLRCGVRPALFEPYGLGLPTYVRKGGINDLPDISACR